jgi:hypothetical protein
MSATGADPHSERVRLRAGSRIWGLIRRTLPLGRSIGSLFYLISVGLIASWIIAVFFGASLYSLMPRSAKLEPDVSPGSARFNDPSMEAPSSMGSTSRLDRVSSLPPPEAPHPMDNAAADKGRPVLAPGSPMTANVNPHPMPAETTAHIIDEPPGQALTAELGSVSAAGVAAPIPAPQSLHSPAPEPRGASPSAHSRSSRKPLARRPSNTRAAQRHAPVNAIEDVLQKHSRVLK